MDPGNWATSLAGGSAYGYTLLSVIMISNLLAILLQALALKLGIATERDLAQAVRDSYSTPAVWMHWVLCEVAIAACDLAEVIGSAIALNLLFHIPLAVGVLVTGLDVLLILLLQHHGFRLVGGAGDRLIATISVCFLFEIVLSRPDFAAVAVGFVPATSILKDRDMLFIAISILGATVMPHNLYLHSSIAGRGDTRKRRAAKREAIKFATLRFDGGTDAGAVRERRDSRRRRGNVPYARSCRRRRDPGCVQAFDAAARVDGSQPCLRARAPGIGPELDAHVETLAGQITMEGFLNIRLRLWLRRLITRGIAILPAIIVVFMYGEHGTARLLIISQVILSMQLSFAVFPLVSFTSQREKMGEFVNPRWLTVLSGASPM